MLLKGMGEGFLLSEDESLTPDFLVLEGQASTERFAERSFP